MSDVTLTEAEQDALDKAINEGLNRDSRIARNAVVGRAVEAIVAARVAEAQAKALAVEALHEPRVIAGPMRKHDGQPYAVCKHDGYLHPCPTIAALRPEGGA